MKGLLEAIQDGDVRAIAGLLYPGLVYSEIDSIALDDKDADLLDVLGRSDIEIELLFDLAIDRMWGNAWRRLAFMKRHGLVQMKSRRVHRTERGRAALKAHILADPTQEDPMDYDHYKGE